MKKIISIALIICMFISFNAFAQSSQLENLWVSEAMDLGIPLTNTQFINCTFSVEDGKNMMYTTATGQPASLVCYNLNDRKVERELPLEGAKVSWSHGTDANGNVYIATQSAASLFRYDPVTKEIKNFGKVYDKDGKEQTALYNVSFDKDGNPYMGTYPSALIVRYNLKEEKFEIISDKLFPGESYVRVQLIHENGYLYAGGIANPASFVRMNMATKEVEKLPDFTMPDGEKVASFGSISSAGDYLFCHVTTQSKKPITAIYKVSENRWLQDENQILQSYGYYQSPPLDGKVYVNKQEEKLLYAFDLETATYEKTDITGLINRNSKFFEFNTPELPGKTLCTVQSNGKATYTNFEKKTYEDIDIKAGKQPIEIRSLENGLKGTGTITLGSYMGSKMGIMDDKNHSLKTIAMAQVEGMGEANGEYYTCTYPGAKINTINFEDLTSNKIFDLASNEQDRPFQIIEAGELVAISSVPDYGQLGGALTLYNPKTKNVDVYRNLVKDQSVIGIAYKDGKIYGTTAIWGGLGIPPTTEESEIFIFDLETRKVENSKTIKLKSNDKTMFAGELSFAKDGSLWCATYGSVFEINPTTLEIMHEIPIEAQTFSKDQPIYSPFSIEWISDEMFITNAGLVLSAVDIKTKKFKKLHNDTIRYMTVSENENIYFTDKNRSRLYKMAFSLNGDRAKYLNSKLAIDDSVILKMEKNNAYINRFKYPLDVAPFTSNERTMVPIRFVSEAFGAKVTWNDELQTANITLGDKNISIKVNDEKMQVNNQEIVLDVAPIIKDDRTMVPLRAVSEALSKSVNWDDRGLIIITSDEIEKNESEIAGIINCFE